MIAITKPNDPGNYRPITITSKWRKITSKVVLKLHSQTMSLILPQGQYGVGTPYGAESIITSLQTVLHLCVEEKQSLIITQFDLTNAYNCVNRKQMLNILLGAGLHPLALTYFAQMFQEEGIYFYEGEKPRIIPNARGVSQGKTWSPMLFSMYLADTIGSIHRAAIINNKMTEHVINLCNVPPVFSYLDDIFLISPRLPTAQYMSQLLIYDLVKIGMKPNLTKTKCLHLNIEGKVEQLSTMEII